ncbi:RIKEN cDNA 4930583K01 [Mus musculus]|jgi:hypothetical protein|uniref:Uncharacterized protein n=1 Tax=Mus musculus TaxID=10090 RepID=Q8CER1_MOUSE|nr:RIKEN cDNA 4930583K01 [Mus musculus]BAC25480.1 unnamed protein product [Mus musculus]
METGSCSGSPSANLAYMGHCLPNPQEIKLSLKYLIIRRYLPMSISLTFFHHLILSMPTNPSMKEDPAIPKDNQMIFFLFLPPTLPTIAEEVGGKSSEKYDL